MTLPAPAPSSRSTPVPWSLWLGAFSVGGWFCCPLWIVTSPVLLPLALAGAFRGVREYRTARRAAAPVGKAVLGLVLSVLGAAAATAYLVYVAAHPDLIAED
ncbi:MULTISPECIES: hypothetical protein [unclassified Streptomyces]|uniref:DUF4190 domain-containing protein n=1 Tax=Streptomyces evansiae TaxID=3075535 RepID=A0ABD5E748_9ACTN|nr:MULTISPECIES: hypothetical protein [unclassified Streptomyces]MDT0417183.1 hypothetical protein [Streptomyces sp. DSM 41982]MDT0422629.1 hypothetical protein [Streptomyces sp. DSM 41859]SCE18464.1 hypothetical protein GA0115246_1121318 [Streptomyces sp. SolWspMP-sol7th]